MNLTSPERGPVAGAAIGPEDDGAALGEFVEIPAARQEAGVR